jgi:phosphoadenosine phosphosulfate reductase
MSNLDLFSGKDKTEIAIECLRLFEPKDGSAYWGATSFGKDSVVIMELGRLSGCNIEWHHGLTTLDPPELIKFGKKHFPFVKIHKPKIPLLHELPHRGFPTSANRWCCDDYKEKYASGRRIILGVRQAESKKRSNRGMVEHCKKDLTKEFINPIVFWSDADVWEFIRSRNLPYCSLYDEGFKRIGCVMCPKASLANRLREAARWPGMAKAWKKSFYKLWDERGHRESFARWTSAEDMFNWWLYEDQPALPDEDCQTVMFE